MKCNDFFFLNLRTVKDLVKPKALLKQRDEKIPFDCEGHTSHQTNIIMDAHAALLNKKHNDCHLNSGNCIPVAMLLMLFVFRW